MTRKRLSIPEAGLVLFQGDSITDAGRDRLDGESLGRGYALMAAGRYSLQRAENRVRFLNRGIGGNQARDLRLRWKDDALDLKPDVISILIGTNDAWRHFDTHTGRTDPQFEEDLREILEATRKASINHIILGEPFVLPAMALSVPFGPLHEEITGKGAIARRLAEEFEAVLVPFAQAFDRACRRREPEFWAPDGIHPSPAGHALMAEEWLKAVGAV